MTDPPTLLDVNVLVALMHPQHAHTKSAIRWLDSVKVVGGALICRVTQVGALRLLTKPSVMGSDLLCASEFWDGWDRMLGDERLAYASEPPGLDEAFIRLTRSIRKGTVAGTDAYLAAVALAGGWSLVTFDRPFISADGLHLIVLS